MRSSRVRRWRWPSRGPGRRPSARRPTRPRSRGRDPDAKLRHKPGHRTHLVHRGQVAVDPKARVIVAVEAERATGSEADALETIWSGAPASPATASREVAADAGYASQDAYDTLDTLGDDGVDPAAAWRQARRRRGRPRSGCAPRPAATRRSIARRTPRARSQSSNAMAPAAPDAAAPG